jgi:hypothetical protein
MLQASPKIENLAPVAKPNRNPRQRRLTIAATIATAGLAAASLSGCAGLSGLRYTDQWGTHSVPNAFLAPIAKAASYCPDTVTVQVITALILKESSFNPSAHPYSYEKDPAYDKDAWGATQETYYTWLGAVPMKDPTKTDIAAWEAERVDIAVEVPETGDQLCEYAKKDPDDAISFALRYYYGGPSYDDTREAYDYADWIVAESSHVDPVYGSQTSSTSQSLGAAAIISRAHAASNPATITATPIAPQQISFTMAP